MVFDHEIRQGPAAASYGVEVAREAGVPDSVVDRSRELLDADTTEADDSYDGKKETNGHRPDARTNGDEPDAEANTNDVNADLAETIRERNLATTTPMEALTLLQELQEWVEKG